MKFFKEKVYHISNSKQLVENTKEFFPIIYKNFNFVHSSKYIYCGWGRKPSGKSAMKKAKRWHTDYLLLEDGFIRSIGLGIDASPSFSIVKDDLGIYYDATVPSRLEKLLNEYDFDRDKILLNQAKMAVSLILKHKISKYNNGTNVPINLFNKNRYKNILVIAQTANDESLKYGLANSINFDEIIHTAISENPNSNIYIKLHPDTLKGKKISDIDISKYKKNCIFITENINPIALMEYIDHVYTKTSQMGFEALLLGKKCTCFGMPFYAGWGLTIDKTTCNRRKRNLNVIQVFAAAYILYSQYYNPYTKKESNIFDTINTITKLRVEYAT